MKKILFYVLLLTLGFVTNQVNAQPGVFNPSDPDVIFTASNQPAVPAYNTIAKWGHANRLNWGPYSNGYRSYYYNGTVFRLKFPKTYQHNVADGKKYPLFIFWHGLGEKGDIYDNEYQLLHGGQEHANNVDNGKFDGFLLYPQNTSGFFSAGQYTTILQLIDSLAKYAKADVDRVNMSGLSAGGSATWGFLGTYPKAIAGAFPISAASAYYGDLDKHITIPIWIANGGLDNNPAPGTVDALVNQYVTVRGGFMKHYFYPNGGHGIWGDFWNEPDYYTNLNIPHKANPLVYFGRSEFCAGDPISVHMGVQAGFAAYEWSKNGATIAGATSADYTATSFGTYAARFKRTASSAWSAWSPSPIVVQLKAATVTPPITVSGLASKVMPAPDGSTTTPLQVPNTYVAYEWRRVSDNALVSSANTYNAAAGQYKVKVTEQFGCSSSFSDPFTVINAAGANAPDKASNPNAIAQSNTSIQLAWSDNPSPVNNETGFEIYRATTAGGPYTLINITAADVLSYTDNGLPSNKKYYYIVRAVNNNGAAASSDEASATTFADVQVPSAPQNLVVAGTSRYAVTLAWSPSTDDVGVVRYDIYINGNKAYSSLTNNFTVNGLTPLQTYTFMVKAKDAAGNSSPASNQVSGYTKNNGLTYKFYTGSWSVLPNFNALTPVGVGTASIPSLAPATQTDNMGFLWEGFITIPSTGSYSFRTNSDDGSRLWLGALNGTSSPYNATSGWIVDNDGLHGAQDATSTARTLTAGVYPIAIAFFEQGGGESITVSWKLPGMFTSFTAIPASAFVEPGGPAGTIPTAPSNLTVTTASYKQINLTWTDNSNNENGFEVWRSTSALTGYATVGTTAANVTSFADSTALDPSTTYYYKLRAVGQAGASAYIPVNDAQANWKFNNNYTDATGNGRTISGNNAPTFSSTDKTEGTHSVDLNGSNEDIAVSTAAGDYIRGGYTAKTVAFWMRADNTSANRGVFDFGGSDDGIAMYINSNTLFAGIASNNVRRAISAPYSSTGWNHIALVYNVNSLKLYVNGVVVASNTALGFTSVGATSDASIIGDDNGTTAFNNVTFGQFDGRFDDWNVFGKALTDAEVGYLVNFTYDLRSATTQALPLAPSAPAALTATGATGTSIALAWNDNSNNETSFEIWRSIGNNSNYRLLTVTGANATAQATASDLGLFTNVTYYYKVRAKGVGGYSAYSNETSSKTLNSLPVITNIASYTMRYESQSVVNVAATDADGDAIVVGVSNLPAFGSYNSTTKQITFSPTSTDAGVYPVRIIATDAQGGADTLDFALTVNSNYVPVITQVSNTSLDEGTQLTIPLSSTDQDGNGSLQWTTTGLPAFVTLVPGVNGAASLQLAPNYAQAGVYAVSLSVSDGNGGVGTSIVNITVNEKAPASTSYYVSMLMAGNAAAPAPWNNISATNQATLNNQNGQAGPVKFEIMNAPWNAWYDGATTGNNSGVFPDAVIRDYFYFGIFGAPETVTFRLSGLNTANKYNLKLLSSSRWTNVPDNGTTVFTINGVSRSVYAQNNSQNLGVFTALVPDGSGNIDVTMSKAAGTPVGYLNAFVLEQLFDDGTAPVLPTNLTAAALPNGNIKLTWNDVAYNEEKYEVYRSTTENGTYTLISGGAANANATEFTDNSVLSSTSYYYKIAAVNSYGTSGLTAAVSITTGNKTPVLGAINPIYVKTGNSATLNISATDDASDVLTVSVTNLPPFAVYTSTGNGTGNIQFTPGAASLGVYKNVTVKVTDNNGASVEQKFDVNVTDNTTRSVYINFVGTKGNPENSGSWNNLSGYPGNIANYTVASGLKDDQGQTTGFGFKLLNSWVEGWNGGMITGNESGIYPDNVIKSSIYDNATTAKTFQVTGLNTAKRYNIVILSSNNSGFSTQATWTCGAQNIVFDGAHNSTKTIQFNGLTPNASGVIDLSVTKAAAATYVFLNALVVEEYDASTTPIRPLSLFAEEQAIGKVQLKWSDRSYNETGFQIWRGTSASGNYTQLTTVAANVDTYTDNTVAANTRYYYKVKAVNGAIVSGFSNAANAMVAQKTVYVNLNLTLPQAAPWNNTNTTPLLGESVSNLADVAGINTGISLEVTKSFGGAFDQGLTGSSVYPDNVSITSWWVEGRGDQTGILKLTNLHQAKAYRVGIYGSSNWSGDFTGIYTINGQSRYLNTHMNRNKTVYFDKVFANEDGELSISMTAETFANYGFWGAIVLEAYDDDSTSVAPTTPLSAGKEATPELIVKQFVDNILVGNETADVNKETLAKSATGVAVQLEEAPLSFNAFPNPFSESITVTLDSKMTSKNTSIQIYDLGGRVIYSRDLGNTEAGRKTVTISANDLRNAPPGTYFLRVINDGKADKNVKKLIRVR